MSEEENSPSTPEPEAPDTATDSSEPPAAPPAPAAPGAKPEGAEKKIVAGILAILLGSLGIHKFYLGYQKEGIIMLVIGLVGYLLCGIPTLVVWIIGVIEGVMYLTKSDEEFVETYVKGQKPWF